MRYARRRSATLFVGTLLGWSLAGQSSLVASQPVENLGGPSVGVVGDWLVYEVPESLHRVDLNGDGDAGADRLRGVPVDHVIHVRTS